MQQFEYSLVLPFFEIEMKTDLFQSLATAEFSKFAGILSVALSQHQLSGFEIVQLEFHHLHSFVHSDAFLKKKESYTHLNAEFQRIARRDKKAFLNL